MNDYVKAIIAVVPGPVLTWATDWIGIFDRTIIIRPNSAENLPLTAAAVGTVLAIVCAAIYVHSSPRELINKCGYFLSGAGIFFTAIIASRLFLGRRLSRVTAEYLYDAYDLFSLSFLVFVILAILFAIMSVLNTPKQSV